LFPDSSARNWIKLVLPAEVGPSNKTGKSQFEIARSKLVILFLNPFVTKKLHSSGFFGLKFPRYIKKPNIFSWLSYFGYLFSNIF
jgi:hypothetical protein